MAIQIISGASSDIQTIDPTSKAARVTLYGPDGEPLAYTSNRDRGIANIVLVQSTTTSANTVVWAMRNATTGKVIYITRIWQQLGFKGTGAATQMRYDWLKETGCSGLSGGSSITPLLKRTSLTNPDIDARVADTGITLTAAAAGAQFHSMSWSRLTPSATQVGVMSPMTVLEFEQPIELAYQEVLALRLGIVAVLNDFVLGGVEFYGG